MTQKVLKVGTSAAVTLPKKMLEEIGLRIGDRVQVEFNEEHGGFVVLPFGVKAHRELRTWTVKFIERYGPALDALSKK